jgi:hypothetical protein
MGDADVIGLGEGFDRDLPVALEHDPLAPAVAHPVELELIEMAGRRFEIVTQGPAIGIHVDPDPATPGVDLDLAQPGALLGQHAIPVLLVGNVGAVAIEVVAPAVKAADELLALAAGAVRALGCVDELAAAVRADVVKGLDRVLCGTHDQDRVLADLVGDEVADVGDFLDAPGVLPDLRPQQIAFGIGVLARQEGLGGVGDRLAQVFDADVVGLCHVVLLGFSARWRALRTRRGRASPAAAARMR